MTLKYTPKYNNEIAPDFELMGVDGQLWTLAKSMGKNGLVVMFICNHCPYVKSIQQRLVSDAGLLKQVGVNVVAIMSNDPDQYPEDSYEQMKIVSEQFSYPFPYLLDDTQAVGKAYGAVCTPDIFGINKDQVIKYRGRLDAAGIDGTQQNLRRDLVEAMKEMVSTGSITTVQLPSMGCSIKWKK